MSDAANDPKQPDADPKFPERDYGVSEAEGETAAEQDAEKPERDD